MEANIVVKAEDLTPDFADGICKVFSKNALLHIKIEYGANAGSSSEAPAQKRRGPKPKGSTETNASSNAASGAAPTGKKRGRKPGAKAAAKASADASPSSDMPKKRGPKPKIKA